MRFFIRGPLVFIGCVALCACAPGTEESPGAGLAPVPGGQVAGAAAGPVLAEVAATAQSALTSWLHAIPQAHLKAYGFDDASELDAATLGEPVALHEILQEPADPASQDPNALVEAVASQHLVPVLVNGQPRVFLRTRIVEGRVVVAGLGDADDAVQWGIAAARWPAARGYGIRFARRAGGSDFLLVDDGAGTHVVPLPSAVRVFHLDTAKVAEVDLSSLPPGAALFARARAVVGRAVTPGVSR